MPNSPLRTFLQGMRRALRFQEGSGMTDSELLACFVEQRDESAFAVLVQRHGGMVLGVCRRILGNVHDAEDAFQATFLVLARRAGELGQRELVGNWLYGVATRTAMELKARTARRRCREKQVQDMPHPAVEAAVWDDLQPVLDEEVGRLPEKYRVPVVLCELEGRSRREVAKQLQVPEGTLSSRLATARKMLARKLASRGLMLSAGTLAMLLTQKASAAVVSPTLLAATLKAASSVAAGGAIVGVSARVIALVDAVMQGLLTTKVTKSVLLCLTAILCGLVVREAPPQGGPVQRPAPATSSYACQRPPAVPEPQQPPTQCTRLTATIEESRTCCGQHRIFALCVCGPDGVVHVLGRVDLGATKVGAAFYGRTVQRFSVVLPSDQPRHQAGAGCRCEGFLKSLFRRACLRGGWGLAAWHSAATHPDGLGGGIDSALIGLVLDPGPTTDQPTQEQS
jgi:RNA polymerase sigma factor (sigma-70 family)